ncbi:MAG: hypothetical protein ABIS12_03215 [Bacteroidia bacterium]
MEKKISQQDDHPCDGNKNCKRKSNDGQKFQKPHDLIFQVKTGAHF